MRGLTKLRTTTGHTSDASSIGEASGSYNSGLFEPRRPHTDTMLDFSCLAPGHVDSADEHGGGYIPCAHHRRARHALAAAPCPGCGARTSILEAGAGVQVYDIGRRAYDAKTKSCPHAIISRVSDCMGDRTDDDRQRRSDAVHVRGTAQTLRELSHEAGVSSNWAIDERQERPLLVCKVSSCRKGVGRSACQGAAHSLGASSESHRLAQEQQGSDQRPARQQRPQEGRQSNK